VKTLPTGTLATALAAFLALVVPLRGQDVPPDPHDVLTTTLTGSAETGGGDEDGSGHASIRFDRAQGEACFELAVEGVDSPTAAHVHRGARGEDGPPVVSLEPPAEGGSSGCVTVSTDLMDEILKAPEGFYVNVHSEEFPGGAVRGQLSK
jgi:hypothetical protein